MCVCCLFWKNILLFMAFALALSDSYSPCCAAQDIYLGPTSPSTELNNTNNNWRIGAGGATVQLSFVTNSRPPDGNTNGSIYVQLGFNPTNAAKNFAVVANNYGDIYGNARGPAGIFDSQLYRCIELDIKYDTNSTMPIGFSGSVGALQLGLSTGVNDGVTYTNLDLGAIGDGKWHHLSVPIDVRNMPTNCWGIKFQIRHNQPR